MPALGRQWPALATLGLSFVLGGVVDPLLGSTPWWDYARQGDLWEALAPPLVIWFVIAGAIVFFGARWQVESAGGKILLAAAVWGSSIVVWVPWVLILGDAFPEAPTSWIGGRAALGALLLVPLLGVGRLVRRRLRKA